MEQYVIPALDSCVTTITFFNFWMSKFGHDMFILVIDFINSLWVSCHVTVGLFEAIDTSKVAIVSHVKNLLSSYNLLDKLVAYVEDESNNLSTFAQVFTSVVNYGLLGLAVLWHGSCFGHFLANYASMIVTKVYVGFKEVNLRAIQSTI
jgi:hypothetical protein